MKRINPVMLKPEISLPKVLPYQNKNENSALKPEEAH
jgi:hypothetical protein